MTIPLHSQNARLQAQVSNLFILSLAIADLAVGLLVMPLSSVTIVAGRWPFKHNVVCLIWLSADYVASTASIFNLFILSLDRYWAVVHPFRYLRNRTHKRATTFILLIWLISSLWIPAIIFWPNSDPLMEDECDTAFRGNKTFKTLSALMNFYIPLLGMIIISCRIMQAIRLRSKMEIGRRLSAATQKQMQNPRPTSRVNKKIKRLHLQQQQRISDELLNKRLSTLHSPTELDSFETESSLRAPLSDIPNNHIDQYSSFNDTYASNSTSPTINSTYLKKSCLCSTNINNLFSAYDDDDQESFSVQNITVNDKRLVKSKSYHDGNYYLSENSNETLTVPVSNSSLNENRMMQHRSYKNVRNKLQKHRHQRFSLNSLKPILFPIKNKSRRPIVVVDIINHHRKMTTSLSVEPYMQYQNSVNDKRPHNLSVTSSFDDEHVKTIITNPQITLYQSPNILLSSSKTTESHSIEDDHLSSPYNLSVYDRTPSVHDLNKSTKILNLSEPPLLRTVESLPKLPVSINTDSTYLSQPHISIGCCKFLVFLKDPSRAHALQKELKAARQLGILVGLFTVSWLPYFILFMVVAWCKTCVSDSVFLSSIWLGYLNSSLNPLIYPLCNAHFRHAFKKIFYCVERTKTKLPNLAALKELHSNSARKEIGNLSYVSDLLSPIIEDVLSICENKDDFDKLKSGLKLIENAKLYDLKKDYYLAIRYYREGIDLIMDEFMSRTTGNEQSKEYLRLKCHKILNRIEELKKLIKHYEKDTFNQAIDDEHTNNSNN
ncbi:unnamed protein product [Didymodactylos carnosus]|uniref:G-protein coupled receptors family 1 profile domain-containing protein n=1 Tax=Didymodactylos carnosus TaxID=1234261 RepID=A0A813YEN6_9BILA|nr:unnamed protein product [Didymodactylos carnosus]CAF0883309.1 unnamed protein product [Didymodactylos carnosus]CAF3564537.1 unnamed protein product [Didymodactylos carnosus]CAF3669057.1 unnamed protein product [Didymodactylos carnosus]